jgi:2-methylcitrate dehydratase PrpD
MAAAGDVIARDLAAFAVSAESAAIPPPVRHRAALHLMDTLGCGLAAVGTGAADYATAVAARQGGTEEATLLGGGSRVPAAVAALANGARCHALDFDDTHEHGICHASTVVAPAALAQGEARDRGGRDVLDAYVLGSEVALRIATATADGLYARGFHPTSVCGAFGAAAAAARLLGLDAARATCALGIVGSFASGLFEYLSDGSQTKPLHAGWAAQAGVQAALLAEAGASGPASVIEGRFGLIASHTDSRPQADSVTDALGEAWELEEVSIKPFPACHFAHSSTWAAAALADEHGLGPSEIAEIHVRIPAEGEPLVLDPLADKHHPRTPYDAKFSLPFTVAHHLVHGRLGISSFTSESIREPEVLEVASRVRGEPLSETAPSRFAGGARLVTSDGEQLDRFLPHAPGSPRNPLDEDWQLAKFRANAELAIAPGAARQLSDALLAIDDAPALGPVLALAQSTEGRPTAS